MEFGYHLPRNAQTNACKMHNLPTTGFWAACGSRFAGHAVGGWNAWKCNKDQTKCKLWFLASNRTAAQVNCSVFQKRFLSIWKQYENHLFKWPQKHINQAPSTIPLCQIMGILCTLLCSFHVVLFCPFSFSFSSFSCLDFFFVFLWALPKPSVNNPARS